MKPTKIVTNWAQFHFAMIAAVVAVDVHRKGRTRKALFEFLGLKGFSPDFSGKALAAKRGRCHLCDHSVAKHRRPRNATLKQRPVVATSVPTALRADTAEEGGY